MYIRMYVHTYIRTYVGKSLILETWDKTGPAAETAIRFKNENIFNYTCYEE